MEKVSSQSSGVDNKGCPWGINSSEHSYCFWNLSKELKGNPLTDREICNLLNITNAQLQETVKSALAKLKTLAGTEVMDDLISAVGENATMEASDNSIYLPDHFRSKGDVSDLLEQNQEEPKEPKKKIRKGFGMPTHRDGKKVDIWGIYSRKTLEKRKNEKKNKDK
jgi:hypothetical protein